EEDNMVCRVLATPVLRPELETESLRHWESRGRLRRQLRHRSGQYLNKRTYLRLHL
ncbi:hypothetical protein NDU88_002275, partial [Pleurodeles waltl]